MGYEQVLIAHGSLLAAHSKKRNMKKTLLLTLALLLSVAISAQNRGTLLRETFDSDEMPEGWKITGGNTQNWSLSETSFCGGDAYEIKMDYAPYFANGFTRLTFPKINLTGIDSITVSFKHYVDIYTTYPSTIGIATSSSNGMNWNICYEESFYTDGQHNISKVIANDDMGKKDVTICLFFKGSSGNINAIYFDDIEVMTMEATNAKIVSVDIPNNIRSGKIDIAFSVQNQGFENITSFEAEYKVGGITYSQVFETNMNTNEIKQFTFDQEVYLSPNKYDVEINITSVNNKDDQDLSNNTMTKEINVALGTTQRYPMIEHFSSASCAPCVSVNTYMNQLTNNNKGRYTYVKYPAKYPTDIYNTEECIVRSNYYLVSGVPNVVLDGVNLGPTSVSQYQFDNTANTPAFVNIKGAFNIEGNNINITTDIMSYVNLNKVKAFVTVNEKTTTGNVGDNGETSFHHILMKMLDNANGNDFEVKAGEYKRLEFTYDMSQTNVEEMSDLEVAVWIQNLVSGEVFNSSFLYEYTDHPYTARNLEVTNENGNLQITWEAPEQGNPTGYNLFVNNELVANNTKELSYSNIHNSDYYIVEVVALYGDKKSVGLIKTSFVEEEGNENDTTNVVSNYENRFEIYPNPANDILFINAEVKINEVMIYDVYGRQQDNKTTRQQDMTYIDLSNLKSGIYFVKIKTKEGNIVKRIIKQ